MTVHWYRVPLPGTVKLVSGLLFLSRACCQKPLVRSMVVKVSEPARPISSMQSLISLMVVPVDQLTVCGCPGLWGFDVEGFVEEGAFLWRWRF